MQDLLDRHSLILMEAAIVEPIRREQIVALDPLLIHASFIYDPLGRDELLKLYRQYARIAIDKSVPFLMCTPTWRTSIERVEQSAADRNINRHAVEFLRNVRDDLGYPLVKIGGTIGCKHDCYKPEQSLPTDEAEKFHAWQVNELADAGVDFLFGVTLPAVEEAMGIARAMAATNKAYIISFVVNRKGELLDGTSLADAIEQIDNSTSRCPLGYMINCAYPTFLCADQQPENLFTRLIGFQGNASSLDHSQLDCSDQLHMNGVNEWGEEMLTLHEDFGIKILGGCCGTNSDHLRYIVGRIRN